MSDQVTEQLYRWLEEATDLRFGPATDRQGKLGVPDSEEGPGAFRDVLIRARQRQDRIEELLKNAKRVRRRLLQAAQEAQDTYQDKLDEALSKGQVTKAEYSTGIERKADANLLSFDEKRAARAAAARMNAADEVVDALNDMNWGLNGFRTDMRDILRSYQLESNLER